MPLTDEKAICRAKLLKQFPGNGYLAFSLDTEEARRRIHATKLIILDSPLAADAPAQFLALIGTYHYASFSVLAWNKDNLESFIDLINLVADKSVPKLSHDHIKRMLIGFGMSIRIAAPSPVIYLNYVSKLNAAGLFTANEVLEELSLLNSIRRGFSQGRELTDSRTAQAFVDLLNSLSAPSKAEDLAAFQRSCGQLISLNAHYLNDRTPGVSCFAILSIYGDDSSRQKTRCDYLKFLEAYIDRGGDSATVVCSLTEKVGSRREYMDMVLEYAMGMRGGRASDAVFNAIFSLLRKITHAETKESLKPVFSLVASKVADIVRTEKVVPGAVFLAELIRLGYFDDSDLRVLASCKEKITEALAPAPVEAGLGAGAALPSAGAALTPFDLFALALESQDPSTALGRYLNIAKYGSAEARADKLALSSLGEILNEEPYLTSFIELLKTTFFTEAQLKGLAFLKDKIVDKVIASGDVELMIQALDKGAFIGQLLHVSRGLAQADISRGQLLKITEHLRSQGLGLLSYIQVPGRDSTTLKVLNSFRNEIAEQLGAEASFEAHYSAAMKMDTPLGKYYCINNDYAKVTPGSPIMKELNQVLAGKPHLFAAKLRSGEIPESCYLVLRQFQDVFLISVEHLPQAEANALLDEALSGVGPLNKFFGDKQAAVNGLKARINEVLDLAVDASPAGPVGLAAVLMHAAPNSVGFSRSLNADEGGAGITFGMKR